MARDPARVVRGEKEHAVRDISRRAESLERNALEEFTLVMVAELGYPDAPEIAREIRERSDRYSRTFAPAILA